MNKIVLGYFLVLAGFCGYWIYLGGHDAVIGTVTLLCGLITLLFLRVIRFKLGGFIVFMTVGAFLAVIVEWLFWFISKQFSVTGIAAHENFGVDLILTMPWYLCMLGILYFIQKKFGYTLFELFILGGVYEFFIDGVVGVLFKGGNIALSLLGIPFFMVVYSAIIIPPSLLLDAKPKGFFMFRYVAALLPLLAAVPYLILLTLL